MTSTKACLFTLIALSAQDSEGESRAQNQIDAIAQKYPCKIIFISINQKNHESHLRKKIITKTLLPSSIEYDICMIDASPDQVYKIPFLVIPEMGSDFPSFLFVTQSPLNIPLISSLEPYVERIIFDEPTSYDIGSFASSLLALPLKEKYVDLNWVKTKPWRLLFYTLFSNKEKLPHLETLSKIHIHYSSTSQTSHASQAILLQAWIASRLSWKLSSTSHIDNCLVFTYSHGIHPCSIVIEPIHNEIMEPGTVVSIELFSNPGIYYLLTYASDDRHISVHITTQELCEIPYTLFVDSYQKGKALSLEILQQKSSEHYFPCLEILSSSTWQKDGYTI